MSVTNIVTAAFGCGRVTKTRELYQYDYGQRLQFAGLALPDSYVVDFSHHQSQGDSKPQVGGADGVVIPDAYLTSGEDIYAFVFLHAGTDDGETVYRVHIPVKARPRRTEETPTPVQQSAIDEAIAALNAGVERAETAAENAEDAVANVQQTVDDALEAAKESGEFDGPPGPPGPPGDDYVLTEADKDEIADLTVDKIDLDGYVKSTDTSVVTPNGDISFGAGLTLAMGGSGTRDTLTTAYAISPDIKAGRNWFDPIVPGNQHEAVFYGLAKAAGDSTQTAAASSVGNYTDDAKSAIHEMLNSPVTVTGSTPTITALPGIRYVCGEVTTLDITLPASGIVDVVFESGSTPTVLSGLDNVRWTGGFDPDNLDANTTYEINIADGLGVAASWT